MTNETKPTQEEEALKFVKELHQEWGENWDMIIQFFGQETADKWDEICGYKE